MTETIRREVCECCDGEATVVRGDYQYTESGLRNVWLHGIELVRCGSCGNEDPVIPRLTHLQHLLALAIAEKPCRLEGLEVRFLRKHVGLTQQELAELIGVDKTTVSKWENEEAEIGAQSERLIRMVAIGLSKGQPEQVREVIDSLSRIRVCTQQPRLNIDAEAASFAYA